MKSIGGKTCFELLVFYAYDNEKRNAVFLLLKFKQSLEYAQSKIVDYLLSSIQKGVFRPTVSVDSIIMFICISIDGISQNASMSVVDNNSSDKTLKSNISEMFETLAKAVINFLE